MGGTRNPRIPEWSSGGRKDSNRRPATGRLPRRTTGTPQPTEAPPNSSFIPDEFRTENDLPLVPDSPQLQTGGREGVETHLNIPLDQDTNAISEADSGPGQPMLFADKYELLVKVGEGGMGSVYKAHNRLLGVDVALKVLTPEKITSPDVRERFLREARATQMFRHRHAIAVQEVGELSDGTVYLTMDFSSGENLDARIKRLGHLSLDEAILITLQVLDALAEAHRTGIVHRDLKPGNIMVEIVGGKPSAMVVDFGIAKILQDTGIVRGHAPLTSPGLILGTVEYMSPEQAGGAVVDARSDIYSMGAVLYHMLTGQLPSPSDTVQNMIINIMFQPPRAIRELITDGTIPPEVEAVVMKALSKSTDERYQSAHEFGQALRVASADYLPDDTRTQSSSFRLPATIVNDPVSVPTVHFLAPYADQTAGQPSRIQMGTAQKALALVAILLLVAVVGIAVYKKMGANAGGDRQHTATLLHDMQTEAVKSGDWEKLYNTAHDLTTADPNNALAARYEWIAGTERVIKQAETFGPGAPENYLGGLNSAAKTLATRSADSPEYKELQATYDPRLKKTQALLNGYLRLKDAGTALQDIDYAKALQYLIDADGQFMAAGQPAPSRLAELRLRANYNLALQHAKDALRAAVEAEAATPVPQDAAADKAWLKMLDELRAALRLENLQPDGTLPEQARAVYMPCLVEYVKSSHDRGQRFLPLGPVGDLSDLDLIQLPQQVDLCHEFLKRRQEPLAVPCAPDRPMVLSTYVPDGAFQSIHDDLDQAFTERLVREADWQQKNYRLDLSTLLLKKALQIALPEGVPLLRKKIDDIANQQTDMDQQLKAAHRAHLDGQELEAEELYNRYLRLYAASPQAPQALAELRVIKASIEKAVGFKVTSTPSHAEVYLNGQEHAVGHTPMILTTDLGLRLNQNNTIELRLSGFDPLVNTRRFNGGGLVPIDFTLQPKHGKLLVRVGEANVALILTPIDANDKPADMPWNLKRSNQMGEYQWDDIPVGKYLLDIQPPVGLAPMKLVVTITEAGSGPVDPSGNGPAMKPTLVEAKLQLAPAFLKLQTDPPGLKVQVNGVEAVGRTPLTLELPAGPVRVVIIGNDGFQLPLDYVLKAGDTFRPPTIMVDFENDEQKNAWASLRAVLDNPQTTPAARVAAELQFLALAGSHARANKVRVDLDEQVPDHLRSLQSDPSAYLAFVADYLHTMPDGRWRPTFRGRVNTLLPFPYLFPAGKGTQAGMLKARAANGWDYLLRWGDDGLQLLSPRGEIRSIFSGFSIFRVRAVQGCDDTLLIQERADDLLGHSQRLGVMVKQDRPLGIDGFQTLFAAEYAEFGLMSATTDKVVWFTPVSNGKQPEKGIFVVEDWKSTDQAQVLPNGNVLRLSAAAAADDKFVTTLQLLDGVKEHYPYKSAASPADYHAHVLATNNTLDPMTSPYTIFRVSPDGSMVILHGVNNGDDDYRVVRTSNLNANDYYSHVGKVTDLIFGSRGTRLVMHGPQNVEVHEIGGLNQTKRQVAGSYDEVRLSPDDQYLILSRASDFAVVEATGNTPPKTFSDQRLLAIDSLHERILCGKDRELFWLYWKSGDMVRISDLDAIWKNAHGSLGAPSPQPGDPAPRLAQVIHVYLLNDGYCALQLQDDSVLYFDVNAPQPLSEKDIALRDKLREEVLRDEGK